MIESVDPVYGAFSGPDQDLATSLSSLDAMASKPLRQHPKTGCADLNRRPAPSFLTCSAPTSHSRHRQKAIQYP
jgi:hypothetical protein